MCIHLYQTYACGHHKLICTTPCLNVLKSGTGAASDTTTPPFDENAPDPYAQEIEPGRLEYMTAASPLVRSASAVSARTAQDGAGGYQDADAGGLRRAESQRSRGISPMGMASPSSSPWLSVQDEGEGGRVPAFRFVTARPNANTNTIEHHTLHNNKKYHAPPPSHSPVSSATPSPSPTPPPPHNCATPHNLPRSLRPCLACYVKPQYEDLRRLWMRAYRIAHPMVEVRKLEGESGIEGLMVLGEEGRLRAWRRGELVE